MNIYKFDEKQERAIPKLGIISHNQLMNELDCSRDFIRSLVEVDGLKKQYIRHKVYFLVTDVMNLLSDDRLSA